MLLYGASGHAKVIIDILKSQRKKISFIFDDDSEKTQLINYRVVNPYAAYLNSNEELIISIGNNWIRKCKSQLIQHNFGITIHTSSFVSKTAQIDYGTVIMQGSIIQSSAKIGKHVIINTNSSIDHDCELENFVHISPGAVLCGNIYVGEGTHIGAGAVIIPNKKIGKWAIIGAGSVIINDIPDYAVVVGNPGKIIKYNYPNLSIKNNIM